MKDYIPLAARAMIAAIDRGRFPPLPETGNRRSLVGAGDVAQALLLAAELPAARGRTYIVTDGQVYSTRRLQDLIRVACGRRPLRWAVPLGLISALAGVGDGFNRLGLPFAFNSVARGKLLGSAWYTSESITAELGFRPCLSLERALPEIIQSSKMG